MSLRRPPSPLRRECDDIGTMKDERTRDAVPTERGREIARVREPHDLPRRHAQNPGSFAG